MSYFGFKYIFQRPSLFGYVIMLFIANLFLGFPNSVHVPMILSRTGNNSLLLGAVETAGAISWTVGSLVMSAWGGPKRRIYGALFGWMFYCIFGNILFGIGRSTEIWIPAILIAGLGSNVGVATSQAILQAKVAPDARACIFCPTAADLVPGYIHAYPGGMLADYVMEPAMRAQGWLASAFGWLVGASPGSGMALMMIFFGLLTSLTMISGYLIPKIRNIEDILPDHDEIQKKKEPASASV